MSSEDFSWELGASRYSSIDVPGTRSTPPICQGPHLSSRLAMRKRLLFKGCFCKETRAYSEHDGKKRQGAPKRGEMVHRYR